MVRSRYAPGSLPVCLSYARRFALGTVRLGAIFLYVVRVYMPILPKHTYAVMHVVLFFS